MGYDFSRCVVYVDGACLGNGTANARAGYGVWCYHDDDINLIGRLKGNQTNQRAELGAGFYGVKQAIKNGYKKVTIKSDSNYLVKGITEWYPKRLRNGTLDEMANAYEFGLIWDAMHDINAKFKWVPREDNGVADLLARRGAHLAADQQIEIGTDWEWD